MLSTTRQPPVIAIVGSRSAGPQARAAVHRVAGLLPAGRRLVTGCAAGVDTFAAELGAQVYRAAGRAPWQLVRRTRAVVAAAAAGGPGSALVAVITVHRSPGTLVAIRNAIRHGLPVIAIPVGPRAVRLPGDPWRPHPIYPRALVLRPRHGRQQQGRFF